MEAENKDLLDRAKRAEVWTGRALTGHSSIRKSHFLFCHAYFVFNVFNVF